MKKVFSLIARTILCAAAIVAPLQFLPELATKDAFLFWCVGCIYVCFISYFLPIDE